MSSFQLTLDTTAPVITWGAISGATPGQTLSVAYTINEPGVVSAEFIDAENQSHPVTVFADHFECELPDDIAHGQGRLRVLVRDDVDNEAYREQNVRVRTVAPASSEVPRTTPDRLYGPHRRAVPARKVFLSRTHTGSDARISAREINRSEATTASSISLRGRSTRASEARTSVSTFRVTGSGTQVRSFSTTSSTRSDIRLRRHDAPDEEALLLDLL